ncbi:hypothetical protein DFH05DRAFT_1525539 [Lentinula detonsa]|uniref:F-box domain-containing protein n=1 Tax=Lentinula detonsa TaxID=2804962 RepID=A0A9W8P0Q2_9AGAR|nr:hypothetical protein DFH05DRAFT_1525539 [Lentinula detonsa]KAJ3980192.1 hypothetical protein F5890DRAFT_1557922 [Lentinula detonsa]
MRTTIYDLPTEIIEEILILCDPIEVGMISCCSQLFYNLIYNSRGDSSQHLWRALYLAQPFDDPTRCVSHHGRPRVGEFNWRSELQAIIRARTVLKDVSICKPYERIQVLKTLLNMVSWVPPLRSYGDILENLSQNLLWVAAVTRGGVFLDSGKIGLPSDDSEPAEEEAHLRARLHTIIGLTPADYKPASRLAARAYVYNMRHYNWANEFGPFLPTSTEGSGIGRVNWVHMRHIHHSITMHMLELADDAAFEVVIYPLSFPYTQIIIPEGIDLDQEEDWAGVNGVWTVSFCFVDHSLLLRYNNIPSIETGGFRESLLTGPAFQEMFRSMKLTLQVTSVKEDPNHPGRPRIYFLGAIAEPSNGSSTINGYVCMTDDNQIRWHFVSGEQGQAIWSSEGVQVGGIRSSYGVLGSWTTIFHDEDDPVGPFWLRKPPTDQTPALGSAASLHSS